MTPDEIVAALEKLGRASRVQIGTDQKTMEALEAKGVVARNGTIDTGSRGRPPIAWVLIDGDKANDVEIAPVKKGAKGSPEHVAAMQEGRRKAREKREKEQFKARQLELERLEKEVPGLWPQYDKAINEAIKKNTNAAWNKANNLQNAIISSGSQIRRLKGELA